MQREARDDENLRLRRILPVHPSHFGFSIARRTTLSSIEESLPWSRW